MKVLSSMLLKVDACLLRTSLTNTNQCWKIQNRSMGNWPKVRPKRVRVITMDVTGTMVSFRGQLRDHYLEAAEQCGVSCTNIDSSRIETAFSEAYKDCSLKYPCFGGSDIAAKDWWKICVLQSFTIAGVSMDERQKDDVFQRIYSRFGSQLAYKAFPDAIPFLNWAQRNGIVCGVLSNADERYGDSILPMLGLSHDYLKFQCFSKDYKMEKPDPRFFMAAIRRAEPWILCKDSPCDPSEVLHIGNDFKKDFEGARSAGIHALLLDRYGEDELADEWRRRGCPVCKDLLDVVEYLGRSNSILG